MANKSHFFEDFARRATYEAAAAGLLFAESRAEGEAVVTSEAGCTFGLLVHVRAVPTCRGDPGRNFGAS